MESSISLEGKEFIELKNLLKLTGVCETGGQAKHIISEGEVSVNGEVETRKAYKVRAGSTVRLGDLKIEVIA